MMSRLGATPTTRDLAERLLAYEAALNRTSDAETSDTCHACEKLRRSFEKLLGTEAYSTLLARALALARLEAPGLNSVRVSENGSIKGLTGEAIKSNGILIAHFLGLMETFIGETVTLWFLDDIWPALPGSRMNVRAKNQHDPADSGGSPPADN